MSAFGERIELKAQEIISKITASKVPSYDGVSRTISIPIDDSTLKNFEFSETDPLFTEDYQGEEKNWETYEIRSESHKGTLIVAGNELYISFSSKDYSVLIYPGSEGYYELVAHSTEDKPNFSCGNKNDSEEVTFETEVISELKGGIDAISTELTLPNRRLFRLALNIDKTWIDKFHGNIQQAKAFAAQEVLGANVMFFRPFLNAALVISRDIYAYPNQSLSMEESADLLEKNPGYSSFDIGHLFRGELLDKIAGGRALNGGACGASGKQRDKAVAYSVCRSQGIDCQQTFAHEVGHQLSLNHTWSECPIKQDVRSDAFAKEAADGSSIMSYYGFFRYQCGFRAPTERPVSLHTKYSASSIFNFRKFLERNPNCGIGSPNKAPYLPFKINFDSRIPFRTPFSILVTVLKDVKNIHKVWAESDIVLPKSFTHLGRFDPLIIFMDPEMRSAGTTLRIDFPTFIGSPKSLPCENGSRKWGAAGCFSEQEVPYDHPFRIGLAEGGGGVSSLKFNLHVSGSRFGFNDDYLSNVIWTGGKEETVYWHVGGGSIAKRVNIYFVLNYGNGPEEDIQETFPKTFGSSYRLLASSVSNNGSTKIKVPKANLDGFLLIVPEATTNAPFIFWSRSQDFKIRCGSGSSRPGGSICEGDDCECEEPTATPTPGAETPTATPSANPTFTPTVTPSVTPNLTATPRPTATPGNQCDTVPPCFGRWEEFDSQVQCTVGGNPNYFDFPVNYPPSWGPACNHEVLNSLPYCYGAPCERCKSLRPGKIVWFKLIDQNGNGHPESECCDGYGCSNPPSSAGMLVRGICVECVIGGAE